jgi:hypothetical protein
MNTNRANRWAVSAVVLGAAYIAYGLLVAVMYGAAAYPAPGRVNVALALLAVLVAVGFVGGGILMLRRSIAGRRLCLAASSAAMVLVIFSAAYNWFSTSERHPDPTTSLCAAVPMLILSGPQLIYCLLLFRALRSTHSG